jgi:hypothetical protein
MTELEQKIGKILNQYTSIIGNTDDPLVNLSMDKSHLAKQIKSLVEEETNKLNHDHEILVNTILDTKNEEIKSLMESGGEKTLREFVEWLGLDEGGKDLYMKQDVEEFLSEQKEKI